MRFLRTNTATSITVGPFLDVTNGYTAEVALTATNEAITFMVDTGGVPTLVIDTTATASGGDNDMVHITNDNAGYYSLELTQAQTNYLGRAMLTIQYDTDHRPVTHEFMIIPANVYDSLVLGSATDYLQVDVTQLLGTAWLTPLNAGTPDVNVRQISEDTSAADNMEKFFDGTGYAGGTAKLEVDVVKLLGTAWLTPINAGTPDVNVRQISEDTTAADNMEKYFDGTGYNNTNNTSELSATAVDAIWDEVITSGHPGVGTAAIELTLIEAAVGTPVALDGGTASISGMLKKMADDNGGADFNAEFDSLNKLSTTVTDAVWDEPVSGHAVAASYGKYLDSDISANTDHISADYGSTEKAAIDLLDDASTGTLHSRVADAVWDELASGHTTDGTYGKYLDSDISGDIDLIIGVTPGVGTLAVTYTLTLSDNGLPISNAKVWVSTDSAHANIVASGLTNAFGITSFNLDPGTYYMWRYKNGVNFTNPLQATFSSNATSASGTGTLTDTISTARIKVVTYSGST